MFNFGCCGCGQCEVMVVWNDDGGDGVLVVQCDDGDDVMIFQYDDDDDVMVVDNFDLCLNFSINF